MPARPARHLPARHLPAPRRTAAALLAATLLAGLLAACGGGDDAAPSTSAPSTAEAPAAAGPTPAPPATGGPAGGEAEAPAPVPEALTFTATTVGGDAFDAASVAGRPVVLWFWAPWCAVCRSQAPDVAALVAEHGDDVAVLGVGSLDSGDAIEGFAADVPGPTHLSDPEGELWRRFGISEQSSFVVLDAAGEEVLRTGYADDDALAGAVDALVG